MPTIDSYSGTTASSVDTDDALIMSVDNVTFKVSIAELKKIINTIEEVAVAGTTHTLLATDQTKIVRATNASAKTFTVPPTSGFLIGASIIIRNASATDITIVAGTGVTLNGSDLTISQNNSLTVTPRATDNWDITQ
jgi:hypothetical protein